MHTELDITDFISIRVKSLNPFYWFYLLKYVGAISGLKLDFGASAAWREVIKQVDTHICCKK
jgi:hypothetical protein